MLWNDELECDREWQWIMEVKVKEEDGGGYDFEKPKRQTKKEMLNFKSV